MSACPAKGDFTQRGDNRHWCGIEVAALLDDAVKDGMMNPHPKFLLPSLCSARDRVGELRFYCDESGQAPNRQQ